jgi:hypothetical protein
VKKALFSVRHCFEEEEEFKRYYAKRNPLAPRESWSRQFFSSKFQMDCGISSLVYSNHISDKISYKGTLNCFFLRHVSESCVEHKENSCLYDFNMAILPNG